MDFFEIDRDASVVSIEHAKRPTPHRRKPRTKALSEAELAELERREPQRALRVRRMRAIMIELGWSAGAWSERAGLSRGMVQLIISGESVLTEATARRLATAREMPISLNPGWLLAWPDEPREIPPGRWLSLRPDFEPPRTARRPKA